MAKRRSETCGQERRKPVPSKCDRAPARTSKVLTSYFPKVLSLREYLIAALSALPPAPTMQHGHRLLRSKYLDDPVLAGLLDTALVGLTNDTPQVNFTQQILDEVGSNTGSRLTGGSYSQSEIVELALQTLFARARPSNPVNILTQGYWVNKFSRGAPKIYGVDLISNIPNPHVNALKSPVWQLLLKIVREEVMLNLLLNTSVFIALENECYYQLLGPPVSELNIPTTLPSLGMKGPDQNSRRSVGQHIKRSSAEIELPAAKKRKFSDDDKIRSHSEISFVRSRMFYSRPACNAHGEVTFGLRHIHVLNRYPNPDLKDHTIHVMKYVFPRQFKLHNVFTSKADRSETIQQFQDYTVREEEIFRLMPLRQGSGTQVPKRLRGKLIALICMLQKRQKRCSYHPLIKYYCPSQLCDSGAPQRWFCLPNRLSNNLDSPDLITQLPKRPTTAESSAISSDSDGANIIVTRKESFTDHASTPAEVAAFVKAVVRHVIPKEFLGNLENASRLMRSIETFIALRRFETLSLHEILQQLQLKGFSWLISEGSNPAGNLCQSEKNKRLQLLAEFIYWLFDSFVIPLIQSHFYVTETHIRQKLVYFRHDVWRKLSEPALSKLKSDIFEGLKLNEAKKILGLRKLGYSQVRLLPKEVGVRPIMNLGRREMVKVKSSKNTENRTLKQSINSVLKPVFNVLTFEKDRNPTRLGSSIFSSKDMYSRLKNFKMKLREKGWLNRKLYFVKVDIQSAFDTIPQAKLLQVVENLITEEQYKIIRYTEVTATDNYADRASNSSLGGTQFKMFRKFHSEAKDSEDYEKFEDMARRKSQRGKKGIIYVDKVNHTVQDRDYLLNMLKEHVLQNFTKIGTQFYRQKNGIPQGSVLSPVLCNLLYGDLENETIPYVFSEDGILLRLTDDFLFITLNRENATKFLKTMYDGLPEYGACIGIDKALVNFETSVQGRKIPRLSETLEFPYCGNTIHTETLNIKKDLQKRLGQNIRDSLTVGFCKNTGRTLHRKALSAFKLNAHPMFFDAEHNSPRTVLTNLYRNFVEGAMKFYRYSKSLSERKRPRGSFQIRIISSVFELAYMMFRNRQNHAQNPHISITQNQVRWLGAVAYRQILAKKQTNYHELLEWLNGICIEERDRVPALCLSVSRSGDPYMSSRQY